MKGCENGIKILKGNIAYTETSEKFNIVESGYIVVCGNFVEGVYKVLPERYKNIKINDYGNKLIIPGFIDLHTHASQFAIKGIGYDNELLQKITALVVPSAYRSSVNSLYTFFSIR